MENALDITRAAVDNYYTALEKLKAAEPLYEQLKAYLDSGKWREDFEADEAGKLPSDLKRGVLSEDAIYNLLEEYEEIKDLRKDF